MKTRTRLIRFLEETPGGVPKGLPALPELSVRPEGPAEGEAHIVEVHVKVCDHFRVVLIDPSEVVVVGSIRNDFGSHTVAEGEVLHGRIVLRELLIGGAAHRAHVSHHVVAEKTSDEGLDRKSTRLNSSHLG